MKTIREFDYDLFKIEGDHYIRVKRTGEVVKVSIEVFRLMRNEAMALYKERKGKNIYEFRDGRHRVVDCVHELSLNNVLEGLESNYLIEKNSIDDEMIAKEVIMEFYNQLTVKQKNVLLHCMLPEISVNEYAKIAGVKKSTIYQMIKTIREKFIEFYN